MSNQKRDFVYVLLIAVVVMIGAIVYKCCGGATAYGQQGYIGVKEVRL